MNCFLYYENQRRGVDSISRLGGCRSTYALEMSQLLPKAPQERDQAAIVDRNEDNDAQGVEDCQAGCRDDEAIRKLPVHHCTLLHKEAPHLQRKSGLLLTG